MPNTPSETLACEVCGKAEELLNVSQCYPLCLFTRLYKFLCIDCLPEVIDKVTKWPYLLKHISRN